MRVVVAATAEVAIPTLEWLKVSGHELLRVVTTPDSKTGRGKVLEPSPVSKWAEANNQRCLKPISLDEMAEAFDDCDVVIAIAYGRILSQDLLNLPTYGFLNLHFSLLPSYRGAAPVQWALFNSEKITGITIFKIDKNLDTGPIYSQKPFEIPSDSNASDVLQSLALIGAQVFEDVLQSVEQGVQPTSQSTVGVSFAPKIKKEDAKIQWDRGSLAVSNGVRAFTPNPGAWTTYKGEIFKISRLGKGQTSEDLLPGQFLIVGKKLFVGTLDEPVEVAALTPSGKKEMQTSDWLNGARLLSGDFFE